jgi:hypothetical protein
VLVNANFNDYGNYSSIINTEVSGTTFSTSTRLGYRWLNSNRSWMFGVNAGYDSRPMATGPADTGVNVTNSQTVFFQQVAAGVEAVSNTWNFNAYALVPDWRHGAAAQQCLWRRGTGYLRTGCWLPSPTTKHLRPGSRQISNIALEPMVTVHQALESSSLW